MAKVKKVDHTVDNPGMVKNTMDPLEQNSNMGEHGSWADAIRAAVKGAGKGEMRGGKNVGKGAFNGTSPR